MPSPILARADALMQRRRNPDADSELEDVPVLTDTVNDEDDFPVLLDIDVPPAISPSDETVPMEKRIFRKSATRFGLGHSAQTDAPSITTQELARRVEQRIIAELPRIIEAAIQDYLSEQKNIVARQTRD